MPDEICPLLLTSKSRSVSRCIKVDCKWFYNSPGAHVGRGRCCVHNIGFELSQINSNMSSLINALNKK